LARRQIVRWPRYSAESFNVWSSPSDGALGVILRHSPDNIGWNHFRPANFFDRVLPILTMAIVALSGTVIGWVLFGQ
jgi:hypothetical protein